jgi:hypothetical protein
MALPNPSLGVVAQPVSTYVQPVAAAAELYDQQSVNLALMFSESFSNLSVSAARFAGSLKQDQNQADVQQGQFLVNSNQKSYKQLVADGLINPAENPWLAIGAQQASGAIDGLNARAEFQQRYNDQAAQNPDFFKDSSHFSALASTFSKEANSRMGDSTYLSSAFYESFNPFVASMGMRHLENITNEQRRVLTNATQAATSQLIEDGQDPTFGEEAKPVFQQRLNNYGAITSHALINNVAIDTFVDHAANGNTPGVMDTFRSLKVGTGPLSDTAYAKQQVELNLGRIYDNEDRLAVEKKAGFADWTDTQVRSYLSGAVTKESILQAVDASGNSQEQRDYVMAELQNADTNLRVMAENNRRNSLETTVVKSARLQTAATTPLASLMRSDDELKAVAFGSLIQRMDEFGTSPVEREKYIYAFEKNWQAQAPARAQQYIERMASAFYNGLGDQPGQVEIFNQEVTRFLDPDPKTQGSFPDLARGRDKQDQMRAFLRMNTEESTKQFNATSYAKYSAVLDQATEQAAQTKGFSGTLMALPNDTQEIQIQKADLRGKLMFTRLALGETYDNKDYAISLNRTLSSIMNPSVEKEFDPRLGDILNAYAIGRTNRPMNQAFAIDAGTKNGKVVYSVLDEVVSQIRGGKKPRDAVSDVVQGLQFKTEDFDPNNIYDYTSIFRGNGKDAERLSVLSRDLAVNLGITSGDSSVYFARELRGRVTANLQTTLNADAAFKAAQAEMKDPSNYFVVNGAFLPTKAFKSDITPKVLAFWLDTKYTDMNAKLVVIGETPSGEPMFGVRDSRDNRFVDQIVAPSDVRIDTPEMVQAFVAWLEADKAKRSSTTDMPGFVESLTSTPFGGAY